MSILDEIIARIGSAAVHGTPVAIFDLDSTLFSTQERNYAILCEFAGTENAPAEVRTCVAKLGADDMGWNVVDDLQKRGIDQRDVLKALRRYWFERFFHGDYLRFDKPLAGAAEFVCDVRRAGATVVYLTGRDEPNMGQGTRDSLRAHGFPLDDPGVRLCLKPRFEDEDLAFKRSSFASLRTLGNIVVAFENEPANANLFCEEFPDADVLFLETVHSPNPPPLAARVVRLRDFRRG